jgi:hypothetical protein
LQLPHTVTPKTAPHVISLAHNFLDEAGHLVNVRNRAVTLTQDAQEALHMLCLQHCWQRP